MVNKLKSRIPYLGNNQALKNHIANALRNAGDLNVVIKNIDAIPKENMDSLTKTGLEKFKNEIISEVRQIIKETQGETAEQGSKIEQAGAKQGNKTVVRGNNIQIIENLDEAEIRNIVTNKKRVAVDMLDKETADKMGFKYPDVKRTIYADEITHTLKQHGNEVKEAARGQKAITAKDIANYHKFAKDADKNIIVDGERGQKVLISGKQINGHYVIVEEAQTKNNNLAFKTMYFRKGNVNDNKVFQSAPMDKDSQGLAFSPYKDDAQRVAQTNDSIIPQNSAKDEPEIKTYANPHIGAGLAGGTLNAKDENGNFDAEKFAKGFIYGLFGSKVTAATLKKTNPKLYDQIVNIGKDKAGKESLSGRVDKIKIPDMGKFLQKLIADKNISDKTKVEIIEAAKKRFAKETPKSLSGQSEAQMIVKDKDQKEKRGIYNVAYNDKKSTIIYKDLEAIENAIKFEKGFENKVTKKGFGALHIEKHLNEKNAGWVTQQEYLNMGEVVRKGKLNTDKYGRRSYEYYKNGIRFRVAIGYTGKGKDRVISFFSDRKPKK